MDLTQEDQDAVREMLALLRQVAEDFVHEYFGRMAASAPEDRLVHLSGADGGQYLLWTLVDTVELYGDPERFSEALMVAPDSIDEIAEFEEKYKKRVECFYWAAERCLGSAFRPAMRSGHRKLSAIAGRAVMSGARKTLGVMPG